MDDDEGSGAIWKKIALWIFVIGSIIVLLLLLTMSLIAPMLRN